jgi:hypothetical protein
MRVPILSLPDPEQHLWLIVDPPHGTSGHPVLIDAAGQIYHPADTLKMIWIFHGNSSASTGLITYP